MKKLIALLLCLLLPFAALAEETDVWARLEVHQSDLTSQSAALTEEISLWNSDIEYIEYVLTIYQAQQAAWLEEPATPASDLEALEGEIAYIQALLTYALSEVAAMQAELEALQAKQDVMAALLAGERSEADAARALELLPPPSLTGKHYVQIDIADYGAIIAELDADAAPITVTNFVKLVNEGFYDGLTFHRIISGFMIQGGDPLGNGTGGSSEKIKGEFSSNGIENPIAHERGVLSMARSSAPDSASSQFFIMHEAAPHLDGSYAAFGRVLSGIEVVDAICQNTPVTDSNGTVAAGYQPVITSIRVIDKPDMAE